MEDKTTIQEAPGQVCFPGWADTESAAPVDAAATTEAETAPATQDATAPDDTTYYPIDEELASRAWGMIHMSDYAPGSCTAEYRAAVDKASARVAERAQQVSSFYHPELQRLLDAYSRRLAAWFNANNKNGAAYPSQFISGASGFDMKKHNKQMAREDSLWEEYDNIKGILQKIDAVGTGAVDLTDPNARKILEERVANLAAQLEQAKRVNAYYRKHGTFDGCGDLSPAAAQKWAEEFAALRERCPYIDKPYPDYELTSLRGKIKRAEERLKALNKLEAAKDAPAESLRFDGGEVIRNAEVNRLQIKFDQKPSADLIRQLKENGFRWAPSAACWQRQLTANAIRAARRVLGIR